MVPVLLIDNEDSFSYNLVQLLEENDANVKVVSGKETNPHLAFSFHHILFSPGPGLPVDFPLMEQVLMKYASQKKILGICLGHQSIAEFFGARLFRQNKVAHGYKRQVVNSSVNDAGSILNGLPQEFDAALYHSWAVSEKDIPSCLKVTAYTNTSGSGKIVMGLRHRQFSIEGLQFHPESFLTSIGNEIICNWLR